MKLPETPPEQAPFDRRRLLKGLAVGAIGVSVPTLAYTCCWEPHWIEVVKRPLRVAELPRHLSGKTLVHISDLHVGPSVDFAYISQAVQSIAQHRPDLIVITGDFMSCDHTEYVADTIEVLRKLPAAALGSFACLGNHDYGEYFRTYEVADELVAQAATEGVKILRNETADVGGLQIAAVDDKYAGRARVAQTMVQLEQHMPTLTLLHNPDLADDPGWGDYSGWILAGHTHGGQCKPPFFGPPVLPVRNKRYVSGEIAVDHRRTMYINRGLGHLTQVRFNCRPEITVFTLQRA